VAAAIAPENAMSAPRSDLRRDLSAAIETLPERYRAVVVLYYLEEVSYPEIADILSVPLGTVKTHLHRAKKLLRERMSAR
jgi:RNA polymerase sigma-70 factor (ECF subfamily)